MESCNRNNKVVTLIMPFLCLIILTQAKNHILINQMCNTTDAPAECIRCIENDSSDIQSDEEVIQGMLGCGNNNGLILEKDVNYILGDPSTAEKERDTLVIINPLIQTMIADGGTVQAQVARRKFHDGKCSINDLINSRINKCFSMVSASGLTLPNAVFSGLLRIQVDYKLSYQLISSLKKFD